MGKPAGKPQANLDPIFSHFFFFWQPIGNPCVGGQGGGGGGGEPGRKGGGRGTGDGKVKGRRREFLEDGKRERNTKR